MCFTVTHVAVILDKRISCELNSIFFFSLFPPLHILSDLDQVGSQRQGLPMVSFVTHLLLTSMLKKDNASNVFPFFCPAAPQLLG